MWAENERRSFIDEGKNSQRDSLLFVQYFATKFYELYYQMQKLLHELNYKNIIFLCKNLKYRIHCDINRTTYNSHVLLPQVQR